MSTGPEFSDASLAQQAAAEHAKRTGGVDDMGTTEATSAAVARAQEQTDAPEAVGPDASSQASAAVQPADDAAPRTEDDVQPVADETPGAAAGQMTAVEPQSGGAEAPQSGGAEAPQPIEGAELRGALEAILLVVDEPVTSTVLAQVVGVPEGVVLDVLQTLRREYDDAGRGFELREIGQGWRLYTRADFAPYVERFVLDGQQARLTQAALETLAVVAYRQPVSRSRVSAVRGVNVDGVMRTLVSRGLVEEAGADEESGAILYRTTPHFLERLGLRDLTELPSLAKFLPESTTIDQLEGELSGGGRDV